MTSNIQTTKKKSNFPSTEPALYYLEDVMQRSLTPFFLLGDLARTIVDNLDIEVRKPIEVGILQKHYTEFSRSTLRMLLPPDAEYSDDKITFTHQGTPVKIKIIKRKYSFLNNPDQVFYRLTHFSIPNPFEKYWKVKQLVR